MDISKILKFEPINLTQIIVVVLAMVIVIVSFKTQLNYFVASLGDREIKVKMSGADTTIELGARISPTQLSTSFQDPSGIIDDPGEFELWKNILEDSENFQGFGKSGFRDLYDNLMKLDPGKTGVLNYKVNDTSRPYFDDPNMLKYLSIASEKISYLAFYDRTNFVGVIPIKTVIAGLASRQHDFVDFGRKLKTDKWEAFPGLIIRRNSFTEQPTIEQLYGLLEKKGLSEVPLLDGQKLVGFLSYQSVSDALYRQAVSSDTQ